MVEALFPVKEVPAIPMKGYGSSSNISKTGHKFIVREDTGKVLSCMTDDYKLDKNKEVFDIANPLIKKNKGTLKETKVYANGARTVWNWRFNDIKVEVSEGDLLNPEIIIKNSYDGTVGVHAMGGAFRLVCSNGMIIGSIVKSFNAKHNINNKQLDNLSDIIEETIELTMEVCKENFSDWIKIDIKERYLIELFKLFPIEMNNLVAQYMMAHKPNTLWDLYNCATHIVTHKMDKSRESTHKLEMSIFPFMKSLAAKA